jgi:hypothetical protein
VRAAEDQVYRLVERRAGSFDDLLDRRVAAPHHQDGDGTTHVIFERSDSMARLAALVPKPRVNLTGFHRVFAPNSKTPPRG